ASGQQRGALRLRLEGRGGVPGHEELFIQADRHQLRKVLDHLIENAINYSPEGGTIDVVLRPVSTSERRQLSDVSPHQDDDGAMTKRRARRPCCQGTRNWSRSAYATTAWQSQRSTLRRSSSPFTVSTRDSHAK